MASRNLRDIDLNLLVVFQEMLRSRSISATARRFQMSQPAASNALARLRALLGDELLVRAGNGMQPTRLARLIADDLDEGIARLQAALDRRDQFEAGTSTRRFVIAMTDVGEVYFMPRLLAHCQSQAPHIRLEVTDANGAALREGLQTGRIDLAIGPYQDMPGDLLQRLLFKQACVTLFRATHPFARRPPATAAAWRDARHLMISNMASPYVEIRRRMERAGVRMSAHDQASSFLSAPFIVATSDCVATVPAKLAEQFMAPLGLRAIRPRLRLPELDARCFWHRRNQADPGLGWLRQTLVSLFSELPAKRDG